MSVHVFDDDDVNYLIWLRKNPIGYVFNKQKNGSYARIHRSFCHHTVSTRGKYLTLNFFKVCSDSAIELKQYIVDNYENLQKEYCGDCKDIDHDYHDARKIIEKRISHYSNSFGGSTRVPGDSGLHVEKAVVSTTVFRRNPVVVIQRLEKANGFCQECGNKAPFISKATGEPYLEVHHVIPLKDGGEDTLENTTALCPNCHRKFHHG